MNAGQMDVATLQGADLDRYLADLRASARRPAVELRPRPEPKPAEILTGPAAIAAAFETTAPVLDPAAPPDPAGSESGTAGSGGGGSGGGSGKGGAPSGTGGSGDGEGGKAGKGDGEAEKKKRKGPLDLAIGALKSHHLVTDDAGGLFRWNGQYWAALSKTGEKALALDVGAATREWRSEVIDYWKARTHRAGNFWGRVELNEVAFANGVLNFQSMALRKHRPKDYLERVIPHDWDPEAECPNWNDCLAMWFGSVESDQVTALQEFVGYLLTQHAKYKKALLLLGPTGTGKSRLVEILQVLVGKDKCCTLSVENMDDPVLAVQLQGAALNVVTELPAGALIRDGAFKKLVSTEEPILINRKYFDVATYVPTAKHVIASNTLPSVSDRSEATFARMLLLRMGNKPPKGKAVSAAELDARLAAEAPGIIRWALDGLRRLHKAHGEFSAPASTAELMDEYRREQNPLIQFVEERCERDKDARVPTAKMMREFNKSGLVQHAWSQARFTRTFNDMRDIPDTHLGDVRVANARVGKRVVKCVFGLRLLPEIEDLDAEAKATAAPTGEDF